MSGAFEREVWERDLLDQVREYGDECATVAYHGKLHCRRNPEEVLSGIKDMLLDSPSTDARDANGDRLGMKPHIFREMINELRDTAVKYHDHQSLRERISGVVRRAIQKGNES